MTKIYDNDLVEFCGECPACDYEHNPGRTSHGCPDEYDVMCTEKRRLIHDNQDVPDWCPLEDAAEPADAGDREPALKRIGNNGETRQESRGS